MVKSLPTAIITTVSLAILGMIIVSPFKNFFRRFFPKPGTGPNEKTRNSGWYEALFVAKTTKNQEYVYRMLLRTKDDNLTVSFQNKQVFWEGRTIRPDLVLIRKNKNNDDETFVIDTKWKVLDASNPKPSDNDLKQMYAYNLYWNAGIK